MNFMKYNYLNLQINSMKTEKVKKKTKHFLASSERSSNEHLFGLVLPSNI